MARAKKETEEAVATEEAHEAKAKKKKAAKPANLEEKGNTAKVESHGNMSVKELVQEKQYIQEVPEQKRAADEDELAKEMQQTKLVETDKYLNTGAHIGTKFKSGDMKRYIYKVRKDGLNVLDVQTLDAKLKVAAKFLAGYPKEGIMVVSRKLYGYTPAKTFAEAVGAHALTGRFVPGTFTNPEGHRFVEPKVVVVTEPESDSQAIDEATKMRVPVVAMASTNNSLKNVDLAIPINNKGRKSLALGYWILAKEILKERGEIKEDSEFAKTVEDFEYKMKEGEEEELKRQAYDRQQRFSSRGGDRFGGRQDRGGGRGGGRSGGFGRGGGRSGGNSGSRSGGGGRSRR